MSVSTYSKCPCTSCGVHLEYPVEAEGSAISCPQCGAQTTLTRPAAEPAPAETPSLTVNSLNAAFTGKVNPPRVSIVYQLGLVIVALAMVALPIIYLALVAAAGWAVYYWATHFVYLLNSGARGRAWLFMLVLYLTPLFAGIVMVFFMIKPLFARRPSRAQPLALNPGAEPLLFAFVTKICQTVGAPFPKRIDIDCQLNASASFRRGVWSFLGNDLVLTIGMPLAAGLTLREFAGVLAHEFGHFSQGFGMRLTYIIRSVNGWFARVVYERDAWDLALEEAARTDDIKASIVVGVARLCVWISRQILRALMLIGHAIGCFMLRQMEYDADTYEIRLAGSDAFESTTKRMHVLGATLGQAYKDMKVSLKSSNQLPENFCTYFMNYSVRMYPFMRTQLEDTLGLQPTGLFDTHPSPGDRIRRARQAADPGIFNLDTPASALFSNFEVPAKQVTRLHYEDDLGLPTQLINLTPVDDAAKPAPTVEQPAPEPASSPLPTADSSTIGLRIKRQPHEG